MTAVEAGERGLRPARDDTTDTERIETVVVGAGAGGARGRVSPWEASAASPSSCSRANERIGDTWRQRWDSLRLFTPAR